MTQSFALRTAPEKPVLAALQRTSLVLAVASVLGAAAAPAWAADVCGAGTTTVNFNVDLVANECRLDTGESIMIEPGVTVTSTRYLAWVPDDQEAGSATNGGTGKANGGSILWVVGALRGGLINQAGARLDGVEGILLEGSTNAQIQGGIVNDGSIGYVGSPTWGANRIHLFHGLIPPRITGGISNRGVITPVPGFYGIGVNVAPDAAAQGTIDWVANLQGVGAPSPLTYSGWLPGEYRAIVNSPAKYGQMVVSNAAGSMAFALDPSSTLAAGTTYAGVLQGVPAANLTGPFTGTLGGMTWHLLEAGSGVWDLKVDALPVLAVLSGTAPAGVVGQPYAGFTPTLGPADVTQPLTYAVTGALPPGLTLDTNTGAISGTPTAAGSYDFSMTATNAAGTSAPLALTIVVTAPPPPPAAQVTPVPTLGEWGMIGLSGLLALFGLRRARGGAMPKRRR